MLQCQRLSLVSVTTDLFLKFLYLISDYILVTQGEFFRYLCSAILIYYDDIDNTLSSTLSDIGAVQYILVSPKIQLSRDFE